MKRIFAVMAVLAAVALIGAGVAMAGVVGSKHDLSAATGPNATIKADAPFAEVCVFCHTPHNSIAGSVPLWNRTVATENISYNSYTTTRNTTWTPGAASKACLSCHDGTLGANSLVNAGTEGQPVFSAAAEAAMAASPAAIGQTADALNNDHPVGITITAGSNGMKNPLGSGPVIYSGRVECASCHQAHDNATNPPFLRMSNAASALCTACHAQ
jgi:predicted CXXCH cytochrome family protein